MQKGKRQSINFSKSNTRCNTSLSLTCGVVCAQNREGYGPAPTTYRFSTAQLQVIEDKLTELKDKYSQSPWDTDELSIALVHILNNYIGDIAGEKTFESMMEQFYG